MDRWGFSIAILVYRIVYICDFLGPDVAFLFVRCICVDVYNLWIEKGEVQGICSNVEMTAARPLKTFVFPGGK